MLLYAGPAVNALQTWYVPGLYGLYHWDDPDVPLGIKALVPVANALHRGDIVEQYQETERWWNSANAIGALIDYMAVSGDNQYLSVLDNTFSSAQNAYTVTGWKILPPEIDILQYTNFLNNFYDDEGWWALTWIKAFDLTRNQKYLDMATTIAQDMTKGWDSTFKGGLYWAKDRNDPNGQGPYKNAIANELFMALTTRLYLRTKDATWKTWAENEYDWFVKKSGLIWGSGPNQDTSKQPKYLINDALDVAGFNHGTQWIWSYNQGVILRALCDLSIIFGDQLDALPLAATPLALAEHIADAALTQTFASQGIPSGRTDQFAPNRIMTEPACDPSCGVDNCQFKGIFIRNLAVLYAHDHRADYSTFIKNNANSLLDPKNHNASFQFGDNWSNPPGTVDFVRQTAGIDAINAANRVTLADMPTSLKATLARAGLMPPTGIRDAITWLTPSVRTWALAWTT
jgi:hypothetical protein